MAILSELTLFPIKSCAGIALQEATLTRAGLATGSIGDREWMIVTEEGLFLTQRDYPRMAVIAPQLEQGVLVLYAPGMAALALPATAGERTVQVRVWDDSVPAGDCGDAAAAWLSQVLGTACRLVRFRAGEQRLASARWTAGVPAPTLFADAYPVLIIGRASLDDLNAKLQAAGRAPLPMNRFRPNLVIDGLEAFEEDYVASFGIGAAQLKPVKPCARCPIPSIDQASGLAGPDPLDILQVYRATPLLDGAVCFGMNAIVLAGAGQQLRIGQEVTVELAF